MDIEFSSRWFKENIEPLLTHYKCTYRFYANGDFGSLDQVAFDSERYSGEIDYWSSGRVSINLWDYEKEEMVLNLLVLEDEDVSNKINGLIRLKELLGI